MHRLAKGNVVCTHGGASENVGLCCSLVQAQELGQARGTYMSSLTHFLHFQVSPEQAMRPSWPARPLLCASALSLFPFAFRSSNHYFFLQALSEAAPALPPAISPRHPS